MAGTALIHFYDSLNAGAVYDNSKARGAADETARIIPSTDETGWQVAEASSGHDDLRTGMDRLSAGLGAGRGRLSEAPGASDQAALGSGQEAASAAALTGQASGQNLDDGAPFIGEKEARYQADMRAFRLRQALIRELNDAGSTDGTLGESRSLAEGPSGAGEPLLKEAKDALALARVRVTGLLGWSDVRILSGLR